MFTMEASYICHRIKKKREEAELRDVKLIFWKENAGGKIWFIILLLWLFRIVKTRSKLSDFIFSVAGTGFFFTIVIFNLQFWEVKIVRLKTD